MNTRRHAQACDYYQLGPEYCSCLLLYLIATDHRLKKPRKKRRRAQRRGGEHVSNNP